MLKPFETWRVASEDAQTASWRAGIAMGLEETGEALKGCGVALFKIGLGMTILALLLGFLV